MTKTKKEKELAAQEYFEREIVGKKPKKKMDKFSVDFLTTVCLAILADVFRFIGLSTTSQVLEFITIMSAVYLIFYHIISLPKIYNSITKGWYGE